MTVLQIIIAVAALAVIVGVTLHARLRQRRERVASVQKMLDDTRARFAKDLSAYFGKPADQLTDQELALWVGLRTKYETMFSSQG